MRAASSTRSSLGETSADQDPESLDVDVTKSIHLGNSVAEAFVHEPQPSDHGQVRGRVRWSTACATNGETMQFADCPLQHVGQFFDTLLVPGHLSSCRQASGVQRGNHRGHEPARPPVKVPPAPATPRIEQWPELAARATAHGMHSTLSPPMWSGRRRSGP